MEPRNSGTSSGRNREIAIGYRDTGRTTSLPPPAPGVPGRHRAPHPSHRTRPGAHRHPRRRWGRAGVAVSIVLAGSVVLGGAQLVPTARTGPAALAEPPTTDPPAALPEPVPTVEEKAELEPRSKPGTERRDARRAQRASRGGAARRQLPGWLSECKPRDDAQAHPNGQLPGQELCDLPASGHLLHPDAARDWWRLNEKYRARFGTDLCLTDSYRSYEAQSQLSASKPGLAAAPGTSNHGWGVAMDLCGGVENFDSTEHQWLRQHAAVFGWENPEWAHADGSKPEPWHWEYTSAARR